MNLKAVESREDEKQFKLLYYDFVVKYQFSPQPYCEAAGFQILTALACAAPGEEMPGSAAETSAQLSSRPVAGAGEGAPLQVASLQAGDRGSTPLRGGGGGEAGLESVDGDSSFLFSKSSFTAWESEL